MTVDPSRRTSRAALTLLAIVVFGVGGWVVVNSAMFEIRSVRVAGAARVAEDSILRAAGIELGESLILLRTDDVAARVARDPWIRQVVVERDLPSTAVIRVVERRAVAWLRDDHGIGVVAADGTILERSTAPPDALPGIGRWPQPLVPGARIASPLDPLLVTAAMPRAMLSAVVTAGVDDRGVVLELRDGGEVIVGDAVAVRAKLRAMARMLAWAEDHAVDVGTLDVRAPGAPSLLPAGVDRPTTSSPAAGS